MGEDRDLLPEWDSIILLCHLADGGLSLMLLTFDLILKPFNVCQCRFFDKLL